VTEQQRKILIGVGGAVGLLALVLLLVALTGGGDGDDDVTTGPTSSTSSTTTTQAVEPVSTSSSTTTSSTTSTTAPPPPPSSEPPPPPPLSADGAVLGRPAVSTPRTFRDADGCASLADRGPWEVECDVVSAAGTDLAWMVAEHRGTGALQARVFRRLAGNQWVVALAAEDQDRIEWAGVVVKAEDASGDGQPEIVFGFRHQGTGQILELDVVGAPGEVVLHRELDKGTAQVRPGQIDDWSAQFAPEDANCCPSSFLHSTIRFAEGAWRVVAQEQVDPNSQPPGDF
jgi:hypothetical protein